MRKLTDEQIKQKLAEGRNYKRLYSELKDKFDVVAGEHKQCPKLIADLTAKYDAIIETQAAQIAELQTSAFRIGERVQGTGLGKDFIQTIVSGTNKLYAPGEGIGLETWKSNHAVGTYLKVGFILQPRPWQGPELRPTLDPKAKDGKAKDTRLFMSYPNELLAS